MSPSISFSYGSVSFSAEGDEVWLSAQLDKVLAAVPLLLERSSTRSDKSDTPNDPEERQEKSVGTLASYIKKRKAESNQNMRFLATADWLRLRGSTPLTTSSVSKALSDNQQKRLGNPADCLNQNVRKGFCEKEGETFYITPDGLAALGSI